MGGFVPKQKEKSKRRECHWRIICQVVLRGGFGSVVFWEDVWALGWLMGWLHGDGDLALLMVEWWERCGDLFFAESKRGVVKWEACLLSWVILQWEEACLEDDPVVGWEMEEACLEMDSWELWWS